MRIHCLVASGLLSIAALSPASVSAALVTRTTSSPAAGICSPAFGPSETAIRKRPLALQNEGVHDAFVTCAFTSQGYPTRASLQVVTLDGIAHAITCTGVASDWYAPMYLPKVANTTPGFQGGNILLTWQAADFGQPVVFISRFFSVSCKLPPGTGIRTAEISFLEETGA
jgi:hypothetical protein